MTTSRKSAGFALLEAIVVVAAIAAIGFGVWKVYDSHHNKPLAASSSQATDVTVAPAVASTSDLDKAQKALDQTDPSASDTSDNGQLDSQLSAF